jgi:hypothetical protein
MSNLLPRVAVIAVSVTILVALTAARAAGDVRMAYAHAAVALATALLLAVLGMRATDAAISSGASRAAVGASKAREMAWVWTWGGVAILATYATGTAAWKEWWHFLAVFAAVAIACFFFSNMLARDAAAGKDDEAMLTLTRRLAIGQLVGMAITMVGLVVDGKMTRFLAPRKGWEDWPANNYFFFGALALAILSVHALRAQAAARQPAA